MKLDRWVWALGLCVLSLTLQIISFAPIDIWPAAYVCLVPWLVMVCVTKSAQRVYVFSYLIGAAFFFVTLRWLFMVTAIGSVILFLALAFYIPLVACPVRYFVRRRRLPLAIFFPFVWVGSEAIRSMFVPGLPWNLLGHSQHPVLVAIQISDLVGAYGVSFMIAVVNGFLADVWLARMRWPCDEAGLIPRRRIRISAGFTACVLLFTFAYGFVQLGSDTISDGPRVAVIQGNYPNFVDSSLSRREPTHRERADRYFELIAQAEIKKPDLYLLPETPWFMQLNVEYLAMHRFRGSRDIYDSGYCYERFGLFAVDHQSYIVTGSASYMPTPLDLRAAQQRYNSAFVFTPEGGIPGRYDKIHRVLIGEYVPFRYGPLRFVYLWLNQFLPFGTSDYEYSLTAGTEFTTFTMRAKSQENREYRFATPICYENVMPYVPRKFVTGEDGKKRCDFLLNLSNDGWFANTGELPQHLVASVFRAVENRVGIARAVNTGISGFVDPDGRVHHRVNKNGVLVGHGIDGFEVATIKVDSRHSLYSRTGDVFAVLCAVLWGLFYIDYIAVRIITAYRRKGERP
ncbi:MAG: apolipoprotein N-acyltransferase [Planctomycetes bacterium]|nr:apolipoprotein N-acyltransferase [Planctomycetota bacterium]